MRGHAVGGPFVVVEGADGAGKTTLADALVDRGFSYVHVGAPTEHPFQTYLKVLQTPGPVVIDRFHPSDFAYGLTFRGVRDLSDQEAWITEGLLHRGNAIAVYCDPGAAAMDRNLERGPDNADAAIYEAADKRARVREMYDRFFDPEERLTSLRTRRYDFTTEGALDREVAFLTNWVRGQRWPDDPLMVPKHVPALGHAAYPNTVLVGDRPPPDDAGLVEDLAVFASESGRYLRMAMSATYLDLDETLVLNAIQRDGSSLEDVVDMALWRDPPGVVDFVALGREAEAALRRNGVTHRVVPHPQHWRWFHYKDMYTYGKLLDGTKLWDGCADGAACRP